MSGKAHEVPHAESPEALDPRAIRPSDIGAALRGGAADFIRAPHYGLFFAAFYVVGGLLIYWGFARAGQPLWFVLFLLGFPFLAPFAAVGLYEVSRRRERGEPMGWGAVIGRLIAQRHRQLPYMAVVLIIGFGFWIILARGILAIFLGRSGLGIEQLDLLLTANGIAMLIVGTAVGALLAAALFSVTVVSLPLLLDREVDFFTAMIASLTAVARSPWVMLSWAAIIAVLLVAAMLPAFLGLFVVLPVLGHASWHMYRRVLPVTR